jgi:uncharacterized protein (DUF1697 family)
VAVFEHVAKRVTETTEDMTTVASWIGLTISASKPKSSFKEIKMVMHQKKLGGGTDRNTNTQKFLNIYTPG